MAVLNIKSDKNCKILIDNEEIGNIKANEIGKFFLPKGKYLIELNDDEGNSKSLVINFTDSSQIIEMNTSLCKDSDSNKNFDYVEKYGVQRPVNSKGQVCIFNSMEENRNNPLHISYLDEDPLGKQFDWCGELEKPNSTNVFNNVYRLPVCKNGKWGYLSCTIHWYDESPKFSMLIEPVYDSFLSDSSFDYVVAKKGDLLYVVNLLDATYENGPFKGEKAEGGPGEILFSCRCQGLYPINIKYYGNSGYTFNLIAVKYNGMYGIMTRGGKRILVNFFYKDLYFQRIHEKPTHDLTSEGIICVDYNGKKNILDDNAQSMLSMEQEAKEIYKVGGMWAVMKDDKFQLINAVTQQLFSYYFDDVYYGNYTTDLEGFYRSGYDDYLLINNNKFGMSDYKGDLIIPCEYDSIKHVGEITKNQREGDNYIVSKNNKYGIFYSFPAHQNKDVEYRQIPCIYDRIEVIKDGQSFDYGYIVISSAKFGAFSYKGEQILSCVYDGIVDLACINDLYLCGYDDYVFAVKKSGKWALFVKDEFVTSFEFDQIKSEYREVDCEKDVKESIEFPCSKDGKDGFVNLNGSFIMD